MSIPPVRASQLPWTPSIFSQPENLGDFHATCGKVREWLDRLDIPNANRLPPISTNTRPSLPRLDHKKISPLRGDRFLRRPDRTKTHVPESLSGTSGIPTPLPTAAAAGFPHSPALSTALGTSPQPLPDATIKIHATDLSNPGLHTTSVTPTTLVTPRLFRALPLSELDAQHQLGISPVTNLNLDLPSVAAMSKASETPRPQRGSKLELPRDLQGSSVSHASISFG